MEGSREIRVGHLRERARSRELMVQNINGLDMEVGGEASETTAKWSQVCELHGESFWPGRGFGRRLDR